MPESSEAAPAPNDNQPDRAADSDDGNVNIAGNTHVVGDLVGRDKTETTTAGRDVVGRDKTEIAAGGHVIRAEAGATVIIGQTPTPASTDEGPAPGEPPFKGLQFFDEKDAHLFFGRELLTAKLVGHLREQHILAVVGASGSGKSSVVRAGMVPALQTGDLLADGILPPAGSPRWLIHIITPTAHPLKSLAASLTRHSESVTATTTLMDDLARDPRSLDLAAARLVSSASAGRLLLVVDQFEELFTACKDADERRQFVDNLLTGVAPATQGATTVVITLRADFYAHCFQFDHLREALEKQQATVGPMTTEELRRAIEEPARRSGWDFQPGLVDVILEDVGKEPGTLPLLSHALLETWQRRRGYTLTLEGYQDAGGVSGAIAKTAETAFMGLKPELQIIARQIFVRLTELGEGTQDTRRRAALSELILNPTDEPGVNEVLKVLTDVNVRLLVTDRDPEGEEVIEVAHEALIREWGTLRVWLNENRDGLRLHRHLTEAAQAWDKRGYDPGELYRGARLAQALEWAAAHAQDMNAREREFVEASRAQQKSELEVAKKRAAQLRQRNVYLTSALVLAVVSGLVAFMLALAAGFLGYRSSQYAAEAQRQARISKARELAAAAITSLAIDPERSILLALQAVSTTYSVDHYTVLPQAEDALHQAIQALPLLLSLRGHNDEVYAVAFSPDGKHLATASFDGTARVWDATTGQELLALSHPASGVFDIAFSPDGKRLATANGDGTAGLWDAATGQELLTWTSPTDAFSSISFSPDGKRLATVSFDGTARVWDATTGRELFTLEGDHKGFPGIAFSSDGSRLATANGDGTATVWDAATGRELLTWASNTSELMSVTFSPDSERLAFGSYDGIATVVDATTGEALLVLTGHAAEVTSIVFSADGTRLATADKDGTAKVWDAATGQEQFRLTGLSGEVDSIAFSSDGTRLATAGKGPTARVWDATTGRELSILTGHADGVNSITFSADGTRLASASNDGTAKVWDAATGQELLTLRGHTGGVRSIAFTPDGTRLATAGNDGTARLWDATTGQELLTLRGHTGRVNSVAFSPDGRRLATATGGGTGTSIGAVQMWDVVTGQEHFTFTSHIFGGSGFYTNVVFSPDGKRLAGSFLGIPVVWDVETGRELFNLNINFGGAISDHSVFSIAFSPDGKRLATADADKTGRVWDVATGKLLLTLTGHIAWVTSIAFSPDGKRLATASQDKTAKVWDAATGQELFTLMGHHSYVETVSYSPDGKRLATAGSDGTIRVYVAPIEELIEMAHSRLTRTWTPDECKKYLQLDTCPPTP